MIARSQGYIRLKEWRWGGFFSGHPTCYGLELAQEMELKILMLEDVEDDAWLVDRILKNENIARSAAYGWIHGEEFTAALDTFKPDLILSDRSLA